MQQKKSAERLQLQMADKSDRTPLRMALGNKRHMKFEDPPRATPTIEELSGAVPYIHIGGESWKKKNYQRVERPPRRMTVNTRIGIPSNHLYIRVQGSSSHAACTALISSSLLWGRLSGLRHCLRSFCFNRAHTFSIKLRSGELAGQGIL